MKESWDISNEEEKEDEDEVDYTHTHTHTHTHNTQYITYTQYTHTYTHSTHMHALQFNVTQSIMERIHFYVNYCVRCVIARLAVINGIHKIYSL